MERKATLHMNAVEDLNADEFFDDVSFHRRQLTRGQSRNKALLNSF